MRLWISTVAFENASIEEVIDIALDQKLDIEFTSNFTFDENAAEKVLDAPIRKSIHNYFPAPKEAFVLNLASSNKTIRERSIQHCMSNIELTHRIGANFYGVHAGFCGDPDTGSLGGALEFQNSRKRSYHWDIFVESVRELVVYAGTHGVCFLIENNVLIKENYTNHFMPLFCCEAEELLKLYEEINSPVFGLLLDTGHYKVSSLTLGAHVDSGIELLRNTIKRIHHSDNNGVVDSNCPLGVNYWFLGHVKEFRKIDHVLEVRNLSLDELNAQMSLLRSHE